MRRPDQRRLRHRDHERVDDDLHRRFTGEDSYQMANAVIFFFITLLFAIFQLSIIRRRGGAL